MFKKASISYKLVVLIAIVFFLGTIVLTDGLRIKKTEASVLGLPEPKQLLKPSADYSTPVLKGLRFNDINSFDLEFIVDTEDQRKVSAKEANLLLRYFMAALTVPEDELWVNLSPYEQNKIIPDKLAVTDLGKEMLAQDYILKQLSSSLTHPDTELGRDYWSSVGAIHESSANQALGKVWIKPDKSVVYENGNIVYISEATLKVVAEDSSGLGSMLASIEEDVNLGNNFTKLRQVYHSILLAVWFKQKFKETIYKSYIGQGKIKGIDLVDKNIKEKVWRLYCSSFEKGVYDLLRNEQGTKSVEKKRYFSGGLLMFPEVTSSSIMPKFSPRQKFQIVKAKGEVIDFVQKKASSSLKVENNLKDDIWKEREAFDSFRRQVYGQGGLLHLEDNYDHSFKFIRGVAAVSGMFLGALAGVGFFGLSYMLIVPALIGGALFVHAYNRKYPSSNVKDVKSILSNFGDVDTVSDIQKTLKAVEGFEVPNNSLFARSIKTTAKESIGKLFEEFKEDGGLNLVISSGFDLDEHGKQVLEENFATYGLGDLFTVKSENSETRVSVTKGVPTEKQRDSIREFVAGRIDVEKLCRNVALSIEQINELQASIWYGFFDLLYRQESDDNLTREYTTLYDDGVIFRDPGVIGMLTKEENRLQEDFMVDQVEQGIGELDKSNIMVFATGSGVLVNNLLRTIPTIENLVEYDGSPVSNETADSNRKNVLSGDLHEKVEQITADVRAFDSKVGGRNFDAVMSTASLRLMSDDARELAIHSLATGSIVRDGGAIYYMDINEHIEITEEMANKFRGLGFDVSLSQKSFPGHRDAMFYIFVHQYKRNNTFKKFVDSFMVQQGVTDLYKFFYKMGGYRQIGFTLLKAVKKDKEWQKEQFKELATEFASQVEPFFTEALGPVEMELVTGPSSRMTIDILGGDSQKDYFDSYDVLINNKDGQVGSITIYDGRSIGLNTIVTGRVVLQDPLGEKTLLNQHVLTSRYEFEKESANLKEVLVEILPTLADDINNSQVFERFAKSAVGLTRSEIELAVEGKANDIEDILQSLSNYERERYPSQDYKSFPKAAGVFKKSLKALEQLIVAKGYSSWSTVVSLPDGFQNLVLYQQYGFKPIVSDNDQGYADNFMKAIRDKTLGKNLKERAWRLSKDNEQLFVLLQKSFDLKVDDVDSKKLSSAVRKVEPKGGIDMAQEAFDIKTEGSGLNVNVSSSIEVPEYEGLVFNILSINDISSVELTALLSLSNNV